MRKPMALLLSCVMLLTTVAAAAEQPFVYVVDQPSDPIGVVVGGDTQGTDIDGTIGNGYGTGNDIQDVGGGEDIPGAPDYTRPLTESPQVETGYVQVFTPMQFVYANDDFVQVAFELYEHEVVYMTARETVNGVDYAIVAYATSEGVYEGHVPTYGLRPMSPEESAVYEANLVDFVLVGPFGTVMLGLLNRAPTGGVSGGEGGPVEGEPSGGEEPGAGEGPSGGETPSINYSASVAENPGFAEGYILVLGEAEVYASVSMGIPNDFSLYTGEVVYMTSRETVGATEYAAVLYATADGVQTGQVSASAVRPMDEGEVSAYESGLVDFLLGGPFGTVMLGVLGRVPVDTPSDDEPVDEGGPSDEGEPGTGGGPSDGDEPSDGETPSIDYGASVAENPEFAEGYVLALGEAQVYASVSMGIPNDFSLYAGEVVYMTGRETVGGTEYATTLYATADGVQTGQVSASAVRPMDAGEVSAYEAGLVDFLLGGPFGTVMLGILGRVPVNTPSGDEPVDEGGPSDEREPGTGGGPSDGDEPSDGDTPSIDYGASVAENPEFAEGYVLALGEAQVYASVSMGIPNDFSLYAGEVVYMAGRETVGETEYATITYATADGVQTGQVSSSAVRPMDADEIAAYEESVTNFLLGGPLGTVLLGVLDRTPAAEAPTGEEDDGGEEVDPEDDGDEPSIDYSASVAENPGFAEGYVLTLDEAQIYASASMDIPNDFTLYTGDVVYMTGRETVGETEYAAITYATADGVQTGQVSASALRPMDADEIAAYEEGVTDFLLGGPLGTVLLGILIREEADPDGTQEEDEDEATDEVAGYAAVLADTQPVYAEPGLEESDFDLLAGDIVYVQGLVEQEEAVWAAIVYATEEGAQKGHVPFDALRLLDEGEAAAYLEALTEDAVWIDGIALAILAREAEEEAVPEPVSEEARVEPLWEGGFARTAGDAALLARQSAEGVSLEEALREGLDARADSLELSAFDLTPQEALAAFQAFLDANLTYYYVSGDLVLEVLTPVAAEAETGGAEAPQADGEEAPQAGADARTLVVALHPAYRLTEAETEAAEALTQGAAQSVRGTLPEEAGALETVLYAHDFLASDYALTQGGVHDTSALLEGGAGSGQASAQLLARILTALNVENAVVRSEAMGHAWNMVRVDGSWYHVDASADMGRVDEMTGEPARDYLMTSDAKLTAEAFGHRQWDAPHAAQSTAYDDFDWMSLLVVWVYEELDLLQSGGLPEDTRMAEKDDDAYGLSQYNATLTVQDYIMQELQKSDTYYASFGDYGYFYTRDIPLTSQGYYYTTAQFREIYTGLLNARPNMFYVKSLWGYSTSGGYITSFRPAFLYIGQDRANRIAQFNTEISKILSEIPVTTPLMTALLINDYMCVNYAYDTALNIYDAYNLVTQKKGVCQANTLLYQYLLSLRGITARFVASDEMNHAWNLVYINGSWYHVDTTWNDPTWGSVASLPGYARHKYFLKSDAAMDADHYGYTLRGNATNKSYDNALWNNINSPFAFSGGNVYNAYATGGTTDVIFRWNDTMSATASVPIKTVTGSTTYVGVAIKNGRILYTDHNRVYSMTLTGTNVTTVYTPSKSSSEYVQGIFQKGTTYYVVLGGSYASSYRTVTLPSNIGVDYAAIQNFVRRMYVYVLGRTPSQSEINSWANLLASGSQTGASIAQGFFFGPEFTSKNTTNAQYVTTLYQALMGRVPSTYERDTWASRISGGATRLSLFNRFIYSTEFGSLCAAAGIMVGTVTGVDYIDQNPFAAMIITRLYTLLLGRTPARSEVNNWCKVLLSGTTASSIAKGFVYSPEFIAKQRVMSHRQYTITMYRTFFDRMPAESEITSWSNYFNRTGRRVDLESACMYGPEFAGLLKSYGLK